jgi:group II intron reverse transcriptase/maturase
VYEPCFAGFSYGFRPGRSQHDALDALYMAISTRKVSWILDADLKAFFDKISHKRLGQLLQVRIADKRLLRLIRKWLKTGWMEDGQHHRQEVGTPQGAVISPFLANVFLHYALDDWVHKYRARYCRGEVYIVRYADDVVLGFQYQGEARRFLAALEERLGHFGQTLHPTKTRLIEFGRFAASNRKERGLGKPETFDFLGFTHQCSTARNGKFTLRRTTSGKRFARTLRRVKEALRKYLHAPLKQVGTWLNQVIQGHQNYFAVPGNMDRVKEFYTQTVTYWLACIRRRSQKAKQKWTWARFTRLKDWLISRARCVHPFPPDRFDVIYSR